jgi:PIN domain nuclease of toxin-antitoxin system
VTPRAEGSSPRRDRLLLDTHALLWWLAEPARLSSTAHAVIADPRVRILVSAASGWEIATKVRLGKLPAASELLEDLPAIVAAQGFESLPVTLVHGLHAGGYALPHRDPFDRLLAAQAELEGLTLISLDPALREFPCRVLW